MNFAAPWFLLAAVSVVLLLALAARSRAALPPWQRWSVAALQAIALLAAVVAMAGPWRPGEGAVHRIAVAASTEAQSAVSAWHESLPHSDPFQTIAAGAAPVAGAPGSDQLAEANGTPDLAAALRAAAAAIPAGAAGEIALFGDGRSDGAGLAPVLALLTARGLRLQVRWLPLAAAAAPVLQNVAVPPSVAPGEAFRLMATVHSEAARDSRLEVRSGDATVAAATLQLRPGVHTYAVDCALGAAGVDQLTVQLDGQDRERTAVLVASPLSVLQLAPEPSRRQALAATLEPQGIAVIAPDPSQRLDPAVLARCAAVLVDDLAADAWSTADQELVRDAVLQQGLGLVLAGTHDNLGPGGYAGSPLAPVLPVRMPQREERRDPSISLVLIIDTSGSMGGGRIELAKEVARLAVQKLQPHDKVGIVEFYGSKRWAAPLQPATNTIEITRALNRLQAGGGTIIYDALEEAHYALLNAHTRFQHILVLTDGGVESGPFEALARRMAAAGQTLSTVLIGPQANSPFLLNLAQWGRGRFYSCPDRFQLPELNFREPQSALLPAVQERRLGLQRSAEAEAVAAFSGDELTPTGGLVEASARHDAEVLLRGSGGEPFLVGWDQGSGRVLVMAGQTLGPQSGELRADPSYGAFLADLLRSAGAGRTVLQPALQLQAQERGLRVHLCLPAGTQLPQDPTVGFDGAEAVSLVPQGGGDFAALLPWASPAAAVVTVRSGEVVLARGAAVAPLPRGQRAGSEREVLQQLAVGSGGSVAEVGAALPRETPRAQALQVQPLARWFALLALIAFVLALLLRRLPLDALVRRPRVAPLYLLAAVAFAAGARAQQPGAAPADETAIRAAIDASLQRHGDVRELAERWRDGTPLQHLLLAMATGDLARAAELCSKPPLATDKAQLRVDLLDILGQPKAALAAMPAPVDGTPVQQGEWHLRRALLLHAAARHDEAAAELRLATGAAKLPQFENRVGLLAGMLGYYDLALQWHRPDPDHEKLAFQASLRRGLWQQRRQDHHAAVGEYEAAFGFAPLQRDRYYALAQMVAAASAGKELPALADRWLARARGQGQSLTVPELRVLLTVLRDLGRAKDGLAVLAGLDAKTRHQLDDVALDLALATGDAEAAVAQLRERLQQQPGDAETRSSLALLLSDLQRDADAGQLLQDGIADAGARDLRLLSQTASELGLDASVQAVSAAFAQRAEPGAATEAALMQAAHERRQGRDQKAAQLLLAARKTAERPADKLRIAEQLESLGKQKETIELYRELYAATDTEDLGLRLAWLLSESKAEADRKQAAAIFRRIWTSAGSSARRVQAEEHVLDLAAREGTLADLAIELEQQLADPATQNRPAVRDALVKIYSRARDTFGAVQILRQWAREQPEHAVEALEQEARVYLAAEEFKNHERTLLKLLQLNPRDELDYRQQLAMSALERGRIADARTYLQGFLDRPGDPDQVALEFAAGIYALAGLHEEAVRLYRRALALHPERVETFLLLGNALRSAGERELAIGTFQELLLRPLPDDLFVVAVDGLLNMEAPPEVLAAAARAVRLRLSARPDQVFLHRVLQDLLEAIGDDGDRLMELQDTVVAGGEQRINFVRELMQEAETRRDWATYARHGRTLLLLGDEVPPAVFLSLGEALLQLGDMDAAAQAFSRARLANDFASVEVRMAELYENAGRLAEAERIRRHILRRKPDDTAAMLAVARLAERQGARARALPLYLHVAAALLPQELPASAARPATARPAGRVLPLQLAAGGRNTSNRGPAFAEPFAGVLRCADGMADLAPLLATLRGECGADSKSPPERQLVALQFLRQLALAFDDAGLMAEARSGEDALLAGSTDAKVRTAILDRRLDAGELAGAAAVATQLPAEADDAARWQQLRLLLLHGGDDDAALLAAADAARPALLPDLMQALLLAGRRPLAERLLVRLDAEAASDPDDAGAAAVEAHKLLGKPIDATFLHQRRLQLALQKDGPLAQRVNAILAALRGYPELDAAERQAQLQQLATQVLAAKDSALCERVLAEGSGTLPPELEDQLVEAVFTKVDQIYQIGSRARFLAALPTARGLELLHLALRKFSAEEQRQQCWRILQSPGKLPAAFLLGMLDDLQFDRMTAADRSMLSMVISRGMLPPAVQQELAQRVQQKLPEDASTAQLLARLQPAGEARRQFALQALQKIGRQRDLESRDTAAVDALLAMVKVEDARSLLATLPGGGGPLLLKVGLLKRTEQKQAAADALLAAYRQKPDDTSLLYQAARFCEAEGMLQRAAELYRTGRDRAATWYPYQAQQLARLELELGDCKAALASLQAAKDPLQSNFRIYVAVLSGIGDAEERASVLRTVLQQRAASRRSSSMMFFRATRSGGKGDNLQAALQLPSLPTLVPTDRLAFDDAASDYDLLGWLPEGEAGAADLLRTMTASERDADLGIYRGMLASAQRNGHAEALLAAALQRLEQQPFEAEALRRVLAAAEIGMAVPQAPLRAALLRRMSVRRVDAAALIEMLGVAVHAADGELASRVMRVLLASRNSLTDMRLRSFLPGLLALVGQQAPELLLSLAPDPGEVAELDSELLAALLQCGADAASVRAAWQPAMTPWLADRDGNGRFGLASLPWCGVLLAVGDVDGAVAALEAVPEFTMTAQGPHLFAAAMPPLARWQQPDRVEAVAAAVVHGTVSGEEDRRALFARLGAVLVARLRSAGRSAEADDLQQRLLAAAGDLALRTPDWFPAG